MLKFAVLSAALLGCSMALICGPDTCAMVKCRSPDAVAAECQDGRVDPHGSTCGCCPSCIKYLKEYESCSWHYDEPHPLECGPGLICIEKICQRVHTRSQIEPRQCAENVCRCVDRNGKPIKGYEAPANQAVIMTCECARRNSDIVQLGMNCIQHKCDKFGNFLIPPTTAC